jgi:regulatory protein
MNDSNQLKIKIARFCAWRERCTKETKEKLFALGATSEQAEQLISWLQQENYLNNKRFSLAFASGKLKNNHWGKLKITVELKVRNIDDLLIREAIDSLDHDEYERIAFSLGRKKWNEIKANDIYLKKQKTAAFLAGKGFENDLAWRVAENCNTTNDT